MRIALWTGMLISIASASQASEYWGELKTWIVVDTPDQRDRNGEVVGANKWVMSEKYPMFWTVTLAEAWINAIIPTEAGILAFEGMSHGHSFGKILRLFRQGNGHWRSQIFIDMKEEPLWGAVKTSDGSIIAMTNDRLLKITPTTKKIEILIADGYWGAIDSMTIADGVIYVGTWCGVIKIVKKGEAYQMCWLLPDKEFGMKPPGMTDKEFINIFMILKNREVKNFEFR